MNFSGTAVLATPNKGGTDIAILLPNNLTNKQYQILGEAYKIAKDDGHKNPEILQGILLQESNAGHHPTYRVSNPGINAYFGLAQIKVAAARDVLKSYPELYKQFKFQTKTDDEIRAHLILDDTFNISVASKYLKILKNDYGLSEKEMIRAFNKGPNAAGNRDGETINKDDYVNGVLKKMFKN